MHRYALWVFLAGVTVLGGCGVSNDDTSGEPGADYAGTPVSDDGTDDGSGSGTGSGSDGGGSTDDDGGDGDGSGGSTDMGGGSGSGGAVDPTNPEGTMLSTGCAKAYGSDIYTPFTNYGPVSTGTVSTYPWRGPTGYPESIEDFRTYGPTLPAQVECGANKSVRSWLDVTAGCLKSVLVSGDKKGQIELTSDGYYRSFALPYDSTNNRRVAWHDMAVEYRFYYSAWTGLEGNPGFKAFARYLTEYDLYVGSWRRDGVVQIQKKQCGVYTILKRNANYGPPAPNQWHTIRFETVGNTQRLILDGKLAMETTDSSIQHGTAGIRIDSADGAYIDDWKVSAP